MQQQKSGARIGVKAFLQSFIILLALMIVTGILTLVIPPGTYDRVQVEGREMIDTASFRFVDRPDYAIWRWFTAPLEVFTIGVDRVTVLMIVVLILLIGSSFAVMDKGGILRATLDTLVRKFGNRKYILLLVLSFFFMLLGGVFGILEEVVILVPVMVGLSFALGWDSLVGLGMSILATNMGFSAAIINPFTIGISQRIAGLPALSGSWFRAIMMVVIYVIFAFFLVSYARRIEKDPKKSLVHAEDTTERSKYQGFDIHTMGEENPRMRGATRWLAGCLVCILAMPFVSSLVPGMADLTLPLVGLLFVTGGIGSGLISGMGGKNVAKAMWEGLGGIAPGVPLILMAASVKHIAFTGGIMDTILHSAAQTFSGVSPITGTFLIYAVALILEIFISSGSAKAFLLMPIILPLADLIGVTRQVAVTAYCLGDGFANMAYPTNAMLLIALGLTAVGYPKWIRWTAWLWVQIIAVSLIFLAIAVKINFGPF
jgi:uncharacterized ion transporter superfamily protein YfcC